MINTLHVKSRPIIAQNRAIAMDVGAAPPPATPYTLKKKQNLGNRQIDKSPLHEYRNISVIKTYIKFFMILF